MPDKKSIEPKKSDAEKALEARVEAMMDPDKPDAVVTSGADSAAETVTVHKLSPQSAPALPKKLLKQIPEDKTAKPGELHAPIPEAVEAESSVEPAEQPLEDSETDKAVDDIVAKEGDIVLAVEDARATRSNQAVVRGDSSWKDNLRHLVRNKWTWIGLVTVLVLLFAVPFTRYKALGLVLKRPIVLTILDSKTKTPVSNALVKLGSASSKTDGSGRVFLNAPVGKDSVVISKQYYAPAHTSYFVGLTASPKKPASFPLVATGRLVPVVVLNKISGRPVKGAEIQVLKTTAKTDAKGMATIALPADSKTASAKIKLDGYNPAGINIEITDQPIKANTFELTPSGRIYFLSNLNGSLDVVKSNLDGTDRHLVLEGTGKEDKLTTSLLASRDWRYLVLKARRDGAQPALYLIDTSNDKVTQFDNGNAEFSLVGWYGHSFIYDLTRTSLPNWQAGREVIKSYDAENLQLNQLDQTQAEGDANSYGQQSFSNFYIVNGALVYSTQWYGYANHDLSGKNNTIRAINPNGQNKKDYQSFETASISINQAVLYKPQSIYYAVYDNNQNKNLYYEYENQAVKAANNVDQNTFNQGYPTYLLSPSGTQTFWTELRDGKNTLFIGDSNADHQKQIVSLSDYAPYGWYGDSYTLVSKNNSELYIMPGSGGSTKKPPLKITDYYKPAQAFAGYGYGYGGL